MKLQRGRFIVKTKEELDALEEEKGIKRVIDLDYMGQIEYEGNTIPALRMFIEYNRENYKYYPLDIYDANNNQMFIYGNMIMENGEPLDSKQLLKIAKTDINRNYSLYEYIGDPNREYVTDFWWDIEYNYMIFFGSDKKALIDYFIDSCYKRDGGKDGIKENIVKTGYKIK